MSYYLLFVALGGEGGIRTPDTLASMPHFECGAFNHSATSPALWYQPLSKRRRKNKPCFRPKFGPKLLTALGGTNYYQSPPGKLLHRNRDPSRRDRQEFLTGV